MLVYLDTSALGHLTDRVGATDADEQTLRIATGSHALTIALSAVTIDEVLALASLNHDKAARILHVMLELSDCTRLVKPPDVLLTEQVGAYARGESAPDHYIPMEEEQLSALKELALEVGRPSSAVVEIARQVEAQKDDFQAKLEPGYSKFQAARKALARENPQEKMPTFERYRTDNEREFLERLAQKSGGVLDKVRARGIGVFGQLPCIRVAVGANLSLAYAAMAEKRKFQGQDSLDMHHAVVATATEAFVTDDGPLRYLLHRIPGLPYALWDLRELCARVAASLGEPRGDP